MKKTQRISSQLRIVRSSSFEQKQKLIRNIVLQRMGNYESVLELGGKLCGSDIVVTDALIPAAVIGHTRFSVDDRDLSACWSEAEKSDLTRHLNPVGDLHYHPVHSRRPNQTIMEPKASFTDQSNSVRQASLYFPFNLQTFETRKVIEQAALSPKDGHLHYPIDRSRSVQLKTAPLVAPDFKLTFKEKRERSLWASLIYTSDASEAHVGASVLIHEFCSCDPDEPKVVCYENVATTVLSDEAVADWTGWPLEKIRLRIDRDEVEKEVVRKYRIENCNWQNVQCGYSDWDSNDENVIYLEPYLTCSCCDVRMDNQCCLDGGPQELTYLDKRSGPLDVADLLRVAATLIEGNHATKDFYNYDEETRRGEAIKVLTECLHFLRANKGGRYVGKRRLS
jgi:hypothetical protein